MQGRAQRLRYSEGSNAGYDGLAGAARLLWRSGPGELCYKCMAAQHLYASRKRASRSVHCASVDCGPGRAVTAVGTCLVSWTSARDDPTRLGGSCAYIRVRAETKGAGERKAYGFMPPYGIGIWMRLPRWGGEVHFYITDSVRFLLTLLWVRWTVGCSVPVPCRARCARRCSRGAGAPPVGEGPLGPATRLGAESGERQQGVCTHATPTGSRRDTGPGCPGEHGSTRRGGPLRQRIKVGLRQTSCGVVSS